VHVEAAAHVLGRQLLAPDPKFAAPQRCVSFQGEDLTFGYHRPHGRDRPKSDIGGEFLL